VFVQMYLGNRGLGPFRRFGKRRARFVERVLAENCDDMKEPSIVLMRCQYNYYWVTNSNGVVKPEEAFVRQVIG
jgi:hypothetical protein